MSNTLDDLTPSTGAATTEDEGDKFERSLAEMAQVEPHDPTKDSADQTRVVVIDGHEAASTPRSEGMHGMSHATPEGEVGGGNIVKVLDPPSDSTTVHNPIIKERAALLSPVARAISGFIQRPVNEWGIMGPGDVVKGHMLLLDLNSGEKVRGMDGHRLGEGELYANLRNFPEALSTGDTIQQLLAAAH